MNPTPVFGEISTEVCGVYLAASQAASVGTTNAPSVSMTISDPLDPSAYSTLSPTLPTSSGNTVNYIGTIIATAADYWADTYDISITATSGANVFVNGVKLVETGTTGVFTDTFDIPTATQKIQILVQSGTSAAYIVVLN